MNQSTLVSPSTSTLPTPPRVTVDRRAPSIFGVTATGGSQADCFGAIIDQLRAMRDAGQIGDVATAGEVAA